MIDTKSENNAGQKISDRRWKSVITYAPMIVGLMALVAMRIQGDLGDTKMLAGALCLVALSCLIYALLPGGGHISVQYDLALKQSGINYRPWMGRVANGAVGLLLIAIAAFLILP